MDVGQIIAAYRFENRLSLREFANRCDDVSFNYISMLERGVNNNTGKPSKPSIRKLEGIAKGLGITYDQLMDMIHDRTPSAVQRTESQAQNVHKIPYTPARSMVPIVGAVRCGAGGGLWFEDLQGSEVADVADPSEYFYLRADGDSMEPRIFEGDLILIHAQPEIESGEVGVIVVDQEDGLLKKYIERDDAIILQSYNPNYMPLVYTGKEKARLQVIGKAVQLLRRGI